MKIVRWAAGLVVILTIIAMIVFYSADYESKFFSTDGEYTGFALKILFILILTSLLLLFRVLMGPTAADRVVAVDIFGILIVGLCALLSIVTGKNWYVDIGIAWALQSFVGTLALAKYLEGRALSD